MPKEQPIDTGRQARLLRVVSAFVQETQPARAERVALDSRFERDLALDSLARAELLLRVGREFGAPLPDAALVQAQSAADLLRFIDHPKLVATSAPCVGASAPLTDATLIEVPEQATTLVEVLYWHAAHHPLRPHVVLCGDGEASETMTYAELLSQASALAAGLIARGLRARQGVALMLPTGRAYLASFFAVLLAGGIPVPIYPPARLAQIDDHLRRHAQLLNNAQTVFIITVAQARAVAALLRSAVPALREIVSPDQLRAPPTPLHYRAAPDDVAFLQYTSGSTGNPKGVVLTHANLLANLRAMGSACGVSSADVFVSWLPLYHDMGLIGAWFGSLYYACPLVLMSPQAFLARPARWLTTISRYRGTISAAPNFAYELCARKLADADLNDLDLRSWRLALNGAEPVSAETLDAFAERFAACGLRREALTPVYGLAENSVGLAFPPLARGPRVDTIVRETLAKEQRAQPVASGHNADAGKAAAMRVVACGHPLPGHEIRIVDAAGDEVPERHVGRLQFRGPSATSGYYRNALATRGLIRQGWLDSGDLAYRVEGEIYLTGRAKDLIIRGGRNLYPYELEQAVGRIAGVRKGGVAVFSCADADGANERLVVVAETRATEPQQRAALRQEIADAAIDVIGIPADDVVLAPPNAVLKTSSGKIRRAASGAAYQEGRLGAPAPSAWRIAWRLRAAALRATVTERARSAARLAFGCWCWLLLAALALPVVPLLSVVSRPTVGRRLARGAARVFFALSGLPVSGSGLEKLSAASQLLIVNHSSYLDALLLCALLPPAPGYVFVAKSELSAQRVARGVLRGLGALYVERFAAEKSAEDVDAMVGALRRGDCLVVFPEGTFSRDAGLRAFHLGAFVAATRAAVAVRVVALRGTREVLRDETWMPHYGPLSLVVADTFAADGDDWAAAVRLRDATRAQMLELCGEYDATH